MLGDIVPVIQLIVNHDEQRPTTHPIGLGIENDAHYCVHSFIKTSISGPALQEAYHKAFLHVGGNWRTVKANMKATSLLMQQNSWLYCQFHIVSILVCTTQCCIDWTYAPNQTTKNYFKKNPKKSHGSHNIFSCDPVVALSAFIMNIYIFVSLLIAYVLIKIIEANTITCDDYSQTCLTPKRFVFNTLTKCNAKILQN